MSRVLEKLNNALAPAPGVSGEFVSVGVSVSFGKPIVGTPIIVEAEVGILPLGLHKAANSTKIFLVKTLSRILTTE